MEVQATSMFIGSTSCRGLMEYHSNNAIRCPYNLSLGTFPMPLDGGSTRLMRNLDWAFVDQGVFMSGGMMNGQAVKVRCPHLCYETALHCRTSADELLVRAAAEIMHPILRKFVTVITCLWTTIAVLTSS